ncbi:MAG: SDR family oxidoreductase [Bacteroidia bacterium]|nr:SDR family oxidoreductase [Bacteroidia bacterium]
MNFTLVTGASKGLGKAFAYECAERGMNLLLTARSLHLLEPIAEDIRKKGLVVHTHSCDLLDHVAYRKIFDWINDEGFQVNMLINNAGMGFYGKFDEQSLEKHLEVMHLNMDAMVKMAHAFLNHSPKTQRRYLLNVSSMGAYLPVPYMSIYAASKAFMLSFSNSIRHELKDENVYVTALCPGGIETDFFGPAQMDEVAKRNAKFMDSPEFVVKTALDALMKGKREIVPGITNKIGAQLSKRMPQGLVISQASKMYKPN